MIGSSVTLIKKSILFYVVFRTMKFFAMLLVALAGAIFFYFILAKIIMYFSPDAFVMFG
jgi:hypothetical protein